MPFDGCDIIEIPQNADERGILNVVEGARLVPFEIKRVYYIRDVPLNTGRAGHSHYKQHCLLIAIAGAFDVSLDDGKERRTVRLDTPDRGLLLPPTIWRRMENFGPGSVCLVLSSTVFDKDDYRLDYREFAAANSRQ